MAYSRTFFRDRIVLNDEFKNRTRLDVVQTRRTLVPIAMGEIQIAVLEGVYS